MYSITAILILRDHTFMTSKKNVQFLHPLPLFLSVRMGLNWASTPHPWTSKPSLKTTPSPAPQPSLYPFVFLQKIGMLKIKPKYCLKPSFLQNQTPACLKYLQQNQISVWNTYSRTRHQSGTLMDQSDVNVKQRLSYIFISFQLISTNTPGYLHLLLLYNTFIPLGKLIHFSPAFHFHTF